MVLAITASLHLFVRDLKGIIFVVMVETLDVCLVASFTAEVVISTAFSSTIFSIVEYHFSDPGFVNEMILASLNKKFRVWRDCTELCLAPLVCADKLVINLKLSNPFAIPTETSLLIRLFFRAFSRSRVRRMFCSVEILELSLWAKITDADMELFVENIQIAVAIKIGPLTTNIFS